ncbi:hypothetical protein PTSG_05904 [Salpingoeca rosetta]|uniref:Uncharacterized protein n=1 Tax=Salpingoeca rosetta (strain ATCC 50818 / BSB-021) TaxID=946362 RepID=F2UD45_SALR5|nr:uncharacterized protein PTSG_05904 [Salpingoeca rosetta]EGD74540.1 hypothetical protein PTSG_05904 [Salpingoeca rosetta]|eukprot:XP_004992797.1 hypothetical protein PTSG_05904 [Salpingoeca rosetta]
MAQQQPLLLLWSCAVVTTAFLLLSLTAHHRCNTRALFLPSGVVDDGSICSQGIPADASPLIHPSPNYTLSLLDPSTSVPITGGFRPNTAYIALLEASASGSLFEGFVVQPTSDGSGRFTRTLSGKAHLVRVCPNVPFAATHATPAPVPQARFIWLAPSIGNLVSTNSSVEREAAIHVIVQPDLQAPEYHVFTTRYRQLSSNAELSHIRAPPTCTRVRMGTSFLVGCNASTPSSISVAAVPVHAGSSVQLTHSADGSVYNPQTDALSFITDSVQPGDAATAGAGAAAGGDMLDGSVLQPVIAVTARVVAEDGLSTNTFHIFIARAQQDDGGCVCACMY